MRQIYHKYFNYWWDRNIGIILIIDETEIFQLLMRQNYWKYFNYWMRQIYHKYFNYWWDRIIGIILIIGWDRFIINISIIDETELLELF
jgi:hypothetical protein